MKEDKINISVIVKSELIDYIPVKYSEFIEHFTNAFSRIPDQYKHSAKVEFTNKPVAWEDDTETLVEVCYVRPETNIEYRDRIERDNKSAWQEAVRERKLLETLKAKYE